MSDRPELTIAVPRGALLEGTLDLLDALGELSAAERQEAAPCSPPRVKTSG